MKKEKSQKVLLSGKKSKSIAFRNSNGSVIYFVDSGNKPY